MPAYLRLSVLALTRLMVLVIRTIFFMQLAITEALLQDVEGVEEVVFGMD